MKNIFKLGLNELEKEHLEQFKHFFNPERIPQNKSSFSQIHNPNAIRKALEILDWMFEKEVALVLIEQEPNIQIKDLDKVLEKDIVDSAPFQINLPEGALLIRNYSNHLNTFKAISKSNSVFILDSIRTLYLSFNEVVKELIPPYKEDVYYLSKVFAIPYEDWFLANILYQLEDAQKEWMLKHVDTAFVSSIRADNHLFLKPMSASFFMYIEDFSEVIKKYFKKNQMDDIKNQSFGFNFHFRYQE